MTILEALRTPALFGRHFDGPSWEPWRAFLAALFGLPLSAAQLAVYRRCTGRESARMHPVPREAWVIAGRRGGKSRIAALVAVWLATKNYDGVLAPGERGTLPIIAADRRQARSVLRYVNGLLDGSPVLSQLVLNRTTESVELANRIVIEVHTGSFRSIRGYTVIAAVLDEVAFYRSDDSAAPDRELVAALRPAMATVPGALLLAISSPYARRGVLWDAYRRHFGQESDVLVWQAPTAVMNPGIPEALVRAAYEEDEASAAAEYGAEFRRDLEAFVTREALEACIIPGRLELPPMTGVRYRAFVDPSGGSRDAMTLAIGHAEGRVIVVDAVRERRPPFSPEHVVAEFAALLKAYRTTVVTGDRYAGEWPRERFREHGIAYEPAEDAKSALYGAALPIVNSGRLELLDLPRLHAQLLGLERRTARGGRDSIDHAPGAHDDLANAVAGVVASLAACPGGEAPVLISQRPSAFGDVVEREPIDWAVERYYGGESAVG